MRRSGRLFPTSTSQRGRTQGRIGIRWDRMYQPKKLSVKRDNKVVKKWKGALRKHSNLKHRGSLRIHVLMPKVQSQTASKSCFVDGDDIVLYIDLKNASVLFDKATIDLITQICN